MRHIEIQNGRNCCGCAACADACPRGCITMQEDRHGILYPVVQQDLCVDCGKCVSVCPILHAEERKHVGADDLAYAFAAREDATVFQSSSGGAFSVLADAWFALHGADARIAGAAFDGTHVCHRLTATRAEAASLRKSKYVQSDGRGVYRAVQDALASGKYVMFTGTPCMVAALRGYIGGDHPHLLTIDLVCHGVVSDSELQAYLREFGEAHGSTVKEISFRVKRDFDTERVNPRTMDIRMENGETVNLDMQTSAYLYAFYTSLCYRPSCTACRFACPQRPGDITLGDYWGIEKRFHKWNSLQGVSLVRANTDKGMAAVSALTPAGLLQETSYAFACAENAQLLHPAVPHRNYEKFFRLRQRGASFEETVRICKKPDTLLQKVHRRLKTMAKRAKTNES